MKLRPITICSFSSLFLTGNKNEQKNKNPGTLGIVEESRNRTSLPIPPSHSPSSSSGHVCHYIGNANFLFTIIHHQRLGTPRLPYDALSDDLLNFPSEGTPRKPSAVSVGPFAEQATTLDFLYTTHSFVFYR